MKKIPTLIFSFMLMAFVPLMAQTSKPSGGGGAGGGTNPSVITRPPLGGKPPERLGPKGPAESEKPRTPFERPVQSISRPSFTQPGIVTVKENGAVGVDHLYNVSGNIPVIVEIVKSNSISLGLTERQIQSTVESYFLKAGIEPQAKPGPPLPFFQVLVMVLPTSDGMSAYCSGRLFESVTLDRVILPQAVYFQAITWETQTMVFSSKEDIDKQIQSVCIEMAEKFLERYTYYKTVSPR